MTNDLVLVPSYYRPEYLYLCLERLLAADGGARKTVIVGQDVHVRELADLRSELTLVREVVDRFKGRFHVLVYVERGPHSYSGNTYNVLELYRSACALSTRYVYLVEEDVHVATDFFRWHEAVQERNDYFCSVAWRCRRNPAVKETNDLTAYIETAQDYASVGVCWRSAKLKEVLEHACDEYYRNPTIYLRKKFPHSVIPPVKWTEQDGLIMRLLLEPGAGKLVAWSGVPRCAHVGVRGYHRPTGYRFMGSFDDRIAALRGATTDTDRLRTLARDHFDFPDVESVPVALPWDERDLHVTQKFGVGFAA